MTIFNHTKQIKNVFGDPPIDHISARKAGGTGFATNHAGMIWFLLDSAGDEVSWMFEDGGPLWDLTVDGNRKLSRYARMSGDNFTDVYDQIVTALFEAEDAAVPEDFPKLSPEDLDMGVPDGFIEKLWHIWNTRVAQKNVEGALKETESRL